METYEQKKVLLRKTVERVTTNLDQYTVFETGADDDKYISTGY